MNLALTELQRDRLDRDRHPTWQIERALLEMMDESLAQGKFEWTPTPDERIPKRSSSQTGQPHSLFRTWPKMTFWMVVGSNINLRICVQENG